MSKLLRHLVTWQPRLSPPLPSVRAAIAKCVWWEDVRSVEFIGGRSSASLDLSSFRPVGPSLVRLCAQFGLEPRREELDTFERDPAWVSIRRSMGDLLAERVAPNIASTTADAFAEAVRINCFIERVHPQGGFHKNVCSFLQACLLGNYPFAVDAYGVAFVLCA